MGFFLQEYARVHWCNDDKMDLNLLIFDGMVVALVGIGRKISNLKFSEP